MRALLLEWFFRLLGWLPLPVTHAIGAGAGRLLLLLPHRRVRAARKNLDLCFPELDAAARERLLRRHLAEFGKAFFETGKLWTRDRRCVARLVRRVHGKDILDRELRRGRGLILAVPHLGAWEMIGNYCSMRYPFTALYRSGDSASATIMRKARQRFGATLVPTDNSGIRALYKAIERGEIVAILPDQLPVRQSGGVFAPFFGIPASTMVLLSRLAMKTGAPVMFAYAERLPRGRGYDMHFLPAPAAIGTGTLEESVAIVNQMVEKCARALPEQYQWNYRRFRIRPPGERSPY
jgi:KDO2-lipid IV(A) lauroyltransferase